MDGRQQCFVCKKRFKQILKHLGKSWDCVDNYPILPLHRLRRQCAAKVKERKLLNYNMSRRRLYDPVIESARNKRKYERYQKAKYQLKKKVLRESKQTFHDSMFQSFFEDIKFGPIFPCVCCHRSLFLRTVKEFDQCSKKILCDASLDGYVSPTDDFMRNGKMYLCCTCHRTLTSRMQMPKLCHLNGLELSKVPKCLQLTSLGNQLLAKNLIFIKIRKTPKTRMDLMNDRVS